MTLLVRAIAVVTLLGLSPLAFGDDGWETNTAVEVKAETLGFDDSNVWFAVERRDNWDAQDKHYSEHWQGVIGNTTKHKMFKYGVGYRYINEDSLVEHRPYLFLTPQVKVLDSRLKISARSKLEYRIRDNNQDGFRYKIKPKVSYTIPVTDGLTVSPFVGDEIEYSMIKGDWSGNKVETGIDIEINERYTITPYYEYESDIPSGDKAESRFGISGTLSL